MTANMKEFRRVVWSYYKKHGRHDLPWRKTHNSYHVLVSEIMLQQTQVDRVIPYFRAWLTEFPTIYTLAKAPLSKVLRAWQGLGYNRRAKMLQETAKVIMSSHKGKVPTDIPTLETLCGIGPYTARAVATFSSNTDTVFVETNIRTAIIYHFFPHGNVSDLEILKVVESVLLKGKARAWYAALMDYGAYLKRSGVKVNTRAKGYIKQSTFKGSNREVRGAIIKALTQHQRSETYLLTMLGIKRHSQVKKQLEKLEKEKMIQRTKNTYHLPS